MENQEDNDIQTVPVTQKRRGVGKGGMTAKQKAARLANLKKGRERKLAKVRAEKSQKNEEYDITSETDDSSGDEVDINDLVLQKKSKSTKHKKGKGRDDDEDVREDVTQLKSIVSQLVEMQKKKARKPKTKRETKIVMLPAHSGSGNKSQKEDDFMAALRRSIMS